MRYLITGAGMLGRALDARLRAEGHETRLLDAAGGPGVITGDVRDLRSVMSAMAGVDGVFHTAAIHGFRDAAAHEFFDVNVAGTWTVLTAMDELGVRRLVHASTIGVYGAGGHVRIDDTTEPAPSPDPYNTSKRLAEQVVAYFADRLGIAAVCLRYGGFRELLVQRFNTLPPEWANSGAVVALDDAVTATVNAMARLPLPRPAYVVAPSAGDETTPYHVDASTTEADLGLTFTPVV